MKKALPYLCLLFFWVGSYAQNNAVNININNLHFRVSNSLSPFYNEDLGKNSLYIGNDTTEVPIFSSGLFFAGISNNGYLHLSGQEYRGGSDHFSYGPIANDTTLQSYLNYNRLWKVTQQDIQNHRLGIYTTEAISSWPAHGNISNGEAGYLAPFVDLNLNGIYEPSIGEFPKIKGETSVFYILNDSLSVHSKWGASKMGIEIHVMIYVFNTTSEALNNTVFINYSIYNRSDRDYIDFIVSPFVDADLGCSGDDFFGSDSSRNVGFIFDDGIDSTTGSISCPSLSASNSVLAVKLLNKNMGACVAKANGSFNGICNPGVLFSESEKTYNRMQGLTACGDTILRQGVPSFYAFPNGEVELNMLLNSNSAGWDYRILPSTEKTVLPAHFKYCLDVAYVYYRNNQIPTYDYVLNGLKATDTVQEFYNANHLYCDNFMTAIEKIKEEVSTSIFPNPLEEKAVFSFDKIIHNGKIEIRNMLGQKVKTLYVSSQSSYNFNREGLDNGIYLYSVFSQEELVYSGKLILK